VEKDGYTFTFKGKKVFISKEDIEKAIKNMNPSSTKRPGFFFKDNEHFFRVKDVLEEVQKNKNLQPSKMSGTVRNSVNKFLNMGINVWEKVRIDGGKDIHLWLRYIKVGKNPFSYEIEKSVKSGSYVFNHVGQITATSEELLFTTSTSEMVPEKKGIYLLLSSDTFSFVSESPFLYYVWKTENLKKEIEKIIKILKILMPDEADADKYGKPDPKKYLKRIDTEFHSKFKEKDAPFILVCTNILEEIFQEFGPPLKSVEVYFLEVDDEKQLYCSPEGMDRMKSSKIKPRGVMRNARKTLDS